MYVTNVFVFEDSVSLYFWNEKLPKIFPRKLTEFPYKVVNSIHAKTNLTCMCKAKAKIPSNIQKKKPNEKTQLRFAKDMNKKLGKQTAFFYLTHVKRRRLL